MAKPSPAPPFPLPCRGYDKAPPCWTWPGLVPGLFSTLGRLWKSPAVIPIFSKNKIGPDLLLLRAVQF